jgi:hypothetical protein
LLETSAERSGCHTIGLRKLDRLARARQVVDAHVDMRDRNAATFFEGDFHRVAEQVPIAHERRERVPHRRLVRKQQADRAEVGEAPAPAHAQADRVTTRALRRCLQQRNQRCGRNAKVGLGEVCRVQAGLVDHAQRHEPGLPRDGGIAAQRCGPDERAHRPLYHRLVAK